MAAIVFGGNYSGWPVYKILPKNQFGFEYSKIIPKAGFVWPFLWKRRNWLPLFCPLFHLRSAQWNCFPISAPSTTLPPLPLLCGQNTKFGRINCSLSHLHAYNVCTRPGKRGNNAGRNPVHFNFYFSFTGGSSIEGGRWGRYKQFHIQRGMGPNRWLIIQAIHYIHLKVRPENVNAVNQLYNCVKLPAVVVQVYQPLKCSLAKSHSRQGRNDICGIKSRWK